LEISPGFCARACWLPRPLWSSAHIHLSGWESQGWPQIVPSMCVTKCF
jgi:hypothetical protein